jgi:rhodanese-related sulfurtransferase
MKAFSGLAQSALAQGALDGKTNELIAIAVSVAATIASAYMSRRRSIAGPRARKSSKRWAWRSIWARTFGYVCQPRARRLYSVRGAQGGRRINLCEDPMIPNPSSSSAGSDPLTIELEALDQGLDSGDIIVVDVREPHEYAAGHIPNSVSLPLSNFDPGDLPTGKPVVLVCQSGKRSLAALGRARAAGRNDVRHYAGGVAGWRAHGGPLTL